MLQEEKHMGLQLAPPTSDAVSNISLQNVSDTLINIGEDYSQELKLSSIGLRSGEYAGR